MNLFVASVFSAMAIGGMFILLPYSRISPSFWYIPMHWLMGVGTIFYADFSSSSDALYVGLFFLGLLAFVFGAWLGLIAFKTPQRYRRFWQSTVLDDSVETKWKTGLILFLATLVTVIYYRSVGYNLLLQVVLDTPVDDFTSARLAAYSGERYFAPGYVNQFKNALLPVSLSAFAGWAWLRRSKRAFRSILAVGIPLTLFALLGTGQRAFLVFAFCALVFGMAAITQVKGKILVISSVFIVGIFGLFSFLLGRADEFSVIASVHQLWIRVFTTQQLDGLISFRYVHDMPVTWFGDWQASLWGLLPGQKGSDLAHRIFRLRYGTSRGTIPPSAVASIYHNGGTVFVPIFYASLGMSYSFVYRLLLSGPRTILRCITYGAIFFYLSIYVYGSPLTLLYNGVAALFLLLVIRKLSFLPKFSSSALGRRWRSVPG